MEICKEQRDQSSKSPHSVNVKDQTFEVEMKDAREQVEKVIEMAD